MKMVFCLLVLVPIVAVADHRPEFQSLIDEPANMLDIAMLRLQDFIIWTKPYMAGEYHIAAKTEKKHHVDINANYRQEDGVIHIYSMFIDPQSTSEQMEAGCRRVLTMLRINIGKGLSSVFSHVDGSFRPSENGQPADIYGMVELSCHVYGRGSADHRFSGAMSFGPGEEMEILTAD